jgi:hypothetical protein
VQGVFAKPELHVHCDIHPPVPLGHNPETPVVAATGGGGVGRTPFWRTLI